VSLAHPRHGVENDCSLKTLNANQFQVPRDDASHPEGSVSRQLDFKNPSKQPT
jgi:hypothetical protein